MAKRRPRRKLISANVTTPKRNNAIEIALLIGIFIFSRFALLQSEIPPSWSDTPAYAAYAYEYLIASKNHLPFYRFHTANVKRAIAVSDSLKTRGPSPSQAMIGYPPLAVQLMRLPGVVAFGESIPDLPIVMQDYVKTYRGALFVVDVGIFLLLLWKLKELFGARRRDLIERGFFYILAGLLLGPILYDRLDLLIGALFVITSVLLISGKRSLLSMIPLALGVGLKIIPVLVAPLCILATLPLGVFALTDRKQRLTKVATALVLRTALFAILVALCFVPFVLIQGKESLSFLTFHDTRGIQLESLWSSLIMAHHRIAGMPINLYQDFGGWNIASGVSPAIGLLSRVLILAAVLVSALLYVKIFFGRDRRTEGLDTNAVLASILPGETIGFIVSLLLLAVSLSPVLSPQYLIWLVPLLPLATIESKSNRLLWSFCGVCLLSTVLFPFNYMRLIQPYQGADGTMLVKGPTTFALTLLLARNFLLVGIASAAAVSTWRRSGNPAQARQAGPVSIIR